APYRFLNHSCAPNCQFIEWQIDDDSTSTGSPVPIVELWVHALRDIEPNEELTIDYGWDWQSAIPCKCGAPNCRGWICKEEDLVKCKDFHARDNSHTS
ncbi:MAG: SET domain-containing protein-lysine N-methyltransferase, partial [Thermoguttaceae bacterium]|nr:SET domain-containing protein-lysine N-methyltransferase [Thermoguttaceae bacterium]